MSDTTDTAAAIPPAAPAPQPENPVTIAPAATGTVTLNDSNTYGTAFIVFDAYGAN